MTDIQRVGVTAGARRRLVTVAGVGVTDADLKQVTGRPVRTDLGTSDLSYSITPLAESVKMPGMPQKTRPMPFPVRLTPELRRRLEALAKADRRTLTNYILTVLERHAETADKTRAAEEPRRRSKG